MYHRELSAIVVAAMTFLLSGGAAWGAEGESGQATAPDAQKGAPTEAAEPGAQAASAESSGSKRFVPFYVLPVVVPHRLLVPDVTFTAVRAEIPLAGAQVFTSLNFGVAYGLVKHLHLEAGYAPINLTPKAGYGNPSLGAVYAFVENESLDFTAKVSVTINTESAGHWISPLNVGFPVALRAGGIFRFDTGVFVPMQFAAKTNEKGVVAGLNIPMAPAIQIAPPIAFVLKTGFTIADFGHAGDTMAIPLGFSAVSAINITDNGHGILLSPFFAWPAFVTPGADRKIQSGFYAGGLYVAAIIPT